MPIYTNKIMEIKTNEDGGNADVKKDDVDVKKDDQQNNDANDDSSKADDSKQNNDDNNSDDSSDDDGAASASKKDDGKKEEKDIDYKALFETAEAKRKKAEFTLYKKDKDARHGKDKSDDKDDDDGDTDAKIDAIKQAKDEAKEELMKEAVSDNIDTALEKFADNEDRQKLIQFHYENTIKHSGYSKKNIESDIGLAEMIADRPLIEKRMSEIKKSITANQSKSKSGDAAGVDADDEPEIALTEKDKAFMKRYGITAKEIINNK